MVDEVTPHVVDEMAPNEPWPVIKYVLHLQRAENYYTMVVLVPGILCA